MSVKGLTYGRRYVDREPTHSRYLPDPHAPDATDHQRHLRMVLDADPRGFPFKVIRK